MFLKLLLYPQGDFERETGDFNKVGQGAGYRLIGDEGICLRFESLGCICIEIFILRSLDISVSIRSNSSVCSRKLFSANWIVQSVRADPCTRQSRCTNTFPETV